MNKKQKYTVLAAGALASLALGTSAHAQSADTLIDKLVEKGILTVKEGNELRDQADNDFTRAMSSKSGMPEWVTAMKFNGDLRLRMDSVHNDGVSTADRNRYRYRVRFGYTATLKDDWEIGVLLTSSDVTGTEGDPISQNASFQNNGSKKFVFFDKVYAKWTPLNDASWLLSSTLGKMENPFLFPSTIMFDKDYTPEGLAQEVTFRFNQEQSLKLTTAAFVLDEVAANSRDPVLFASQLRWDAAWKPTLTTTLGAGLFALNGSGNLTAANVPDVGAGNTRNAAAPGARHFPRSTWTAA
jgi:hypothetical protein